MKTYIRLKINWVNVVVFSNFLTILSIGNVNECITTIFLLVVKRCDYSPDFLTAYHISFLIGIYSKVTSTVTKKSYMLFRSHFHSYQLFDIVQAFNFVVNVLLNCFKKMNTKKTNHLF